MRLPLTARDAVLIALALFALGVSGTGLGLALANRLSGDKVDPIERRVEIVRDIERARPLIDVTSGFGLPPIRIEGVPDVPDRIPSETRLGGVIRGEEGEVIRGEVIEIDRDSVLIETSDGERRRMYGTRRLSERLGVGETVELAVQVDRDRHLHLSDILGSPTPSRVDFDVEGGAVIAIGEVTRVSDASLVVATIRGNDVDIAILDPDQTDGIEVGDTVMVVAQRTDRGYVARWVREFVGPIGFGATTRLLPAFAN